MILFSVQNGIFKNNLSKSFQLPVWPRTGQTVIQPGLELRLRISKVAHENVTKQGHYRQLHKLTVIQY